jgi:RNA polymerase sigma-70 factor (ECF subfamily)
MKQKAWTVPSPVQILLEENRPAMNLMVALPAQRVSFHLGKTAYPSMSEEFKAKLRAWIQLESKPFADFVRTYTRYIYSIISRRIHDQGLAEETTQDILIKFHRNNLFQTFRGESEIQFKAYLARICINEAYSALRRSKAQLSELPMEEGFDRICLSEDPIEELLGREKMEQVNQAVYQLPLKYRKVVHLRLLNYKNTEISRMTGINQSTVETRMQRGLEQLRKVLKAGGSMD